MDTITAIMQQLVILPDGVRAVTTHVVVRLITYKNNPYVIVINVVQSSFCFMRMWILYQQCTQLDFKTYNPSIASIFGYRSRKRHA